MRAAHRPLGRRLCLPAILLSAALATGSLLLPASAPASAAPVALKAAIPSAPCQPDGVSAADNAIAKQLRPAMNGRRLGQSVTGYAVSCARAIVANVKARGLNERAAVIAVTTAIAEATLHNYTVAVDHDSLGLFQQRPSQGWGEPVELVDPRYATLAFLNAMLRKHPDGSWQSGAIGPICQRVQGSAFPLAYAPEVHDAQLIVAMLWQRTGGLPGPAATEAAKPTGPFQTSLMTAATSQGPTSAGYDFLMADWNGDRRPDLVTVQHAGTASGRTELTILDGKPALPGTASSFQRLLLTTVTALGPMDDSATFAMADWNGDGKPDLIAAQATGTASGLTELKVVDGASSFQRFLLQTVVPLGPTDTNHVLRIADWNGDGFPDLVVVQKSGAASGRTAVEVLDGASAFQRYLLQSATALGPTQAGYDFAVTDWNGDGRLDLVAIHKSGARSGHTELQVVNGAAPSGRLLQQATTALGPTQDNYDFAVTDWNGDARLDLVTIQKSGTATGRTEVRILAG